MENKNRVRIAVIGAGNNTRRNHLPQLQRLAKEGMCSLIVICDINNDLAREAANKFDFKSYVHNPEDLLNRDDIEAVFIAGTVQTHYEYAKKALQRGMHVFVE